MNRVVKENLGEYETWETVFTGKLKKVKCPMGIFRIGDLTDLRKPGLYRVVLPHDHGRSYHFLITDGVFHSLVRLFLDFVHNWRSGYFENDWRTETHLDDAVRSDNGRFCLARYTFQH